MVYVFYYFENKQLPSFCGKEKAPKLEEIIIQMRKQTRNISPARVFDSLNFHVCIRHGNRIISIISNISFKATFGKITMSCLKFY